ncbi:MAG: hybrid sensor histidine kinase/response regulator [Candidatus Riflebacteria bacterium]|nr:hybrid sensor histidine kinase/response regulator [Candidatus Riflebacteria bacterium]
MQAVVEAEAAPGAAGVAAIADRLNELRAVGLATLAQTAQQVRPAVPDSAARQLAPPAQAKLLIVEDVTDQREALAAVLAARGYSVIAAADGLEGIRAAFAEVPDLIVSDVMMPGLTGYHLCRFLKSSHPLARTPIILLTALGERLDCFWGRRCGADRYLVKGNDFAELLACVEELLATRASCQDGASAARLGSVWLERGALSEQVAGLMDRLLRESTMREEVVGLGRRLEDLPEFLFSSLRLLSELTAFDAAAILLRFDSRWTVATFGAPVEARQALLGPLLAPLGETVEAVAPGSVDWLCPDGPVAPGGFSGHFCAALDVHGQVHGSLGVFRRETAGHFTPADKRILGLFAAEFAGIATVAWGREAIARKNRELLELNRLKDRLSELLVHDVKNAAWAVSLAVESLADDPDLGEQPRRTLGDARNGCRLMTDMMVSLLDIAKMEGAEITPKAGPVSCSEVAREAAALHEGRAARRGLTLSVGDLPTAWADVDLLRRVLSNLIGNAVKHTSRGSIAVEAEQQDAPDGTGPRIILSVRDTGSGIAPEYVDRLFQKYTQAERREPGKGTAAGLPIDRGLGLYFCRLAIEAHGGRIWAESKLGRGSVFRMTLPPDRETYERARICR